MVVVVAGLMILMGVAIAGVWTRDIIAGDKVGLSRGVLRARDGEEEPLFWPHWLAEYATALLLIVGGTALLADTGGSSLLAALALGALFYTSTNALGWALAERDRYAYAVPMAVGILVGMVGQFGCWLVDLDDVEVRHIATEPVDRPKPIHHGP
jgi:hypothetical protein